MNYSQSFQSNGVIYIPRTKQAPNLQKILQNHKQLNKSIEINNKLNSISGYENKFTLQKRSKHLSIKNSKQNLKLPFINKNQLQLIPIKDSLKLSKQISNNLNFVNNQMTILPTKLIKQLNQQIKPLGYDSDQYEYQLQKLNIIFSSCGILLKPNHIFICEGIHSKTKYMLFTSYHKHPQSICCNYHVVIKQLSFLSPLFYMKYQVSPSKKSSENQDKSFKELILITCMKCNQNILKITTKQYNQTNNNNNNSNIKSINNEYLQKKRMVNFSKLISSGRFKKTLINDDSIKQLMQNSRTLSISKTNRTLIKQNHKHIFKSVSNSIHRDSSYLEQSLILNLNNQNKADRYSNYDTNNNLIENIDKNKQKSQQKQKNIDINITKSRHKHNKSQITLGLLFNKNNQNNLVIHENNQKRFDYIKTSKQKQKNNRKLIKQSSKMKQFLMNNFNKKQNKKQYYDVDWKMNKYKQKAKINATSLS